MRRLMVAGALALAFVVPGLMAPAEALACDQYVSGYTRSDGRYVQGYYRTCPNNTPYDNYSTSGNINPYTGQPGYRSPSYGSYDPYSSYSPRYTPQYLSPYSPSSGCLSSWSC